MNQDMDNIKVKIKENINTLINSGQLEDAKALTSQYKKIEPNDTEVYSIDTVILMMEDKLEEAEKVIKEGLIKDSKNFDLLYNLGYLYEKKGFYLGAIEAYENVVFNMEPNDLRAEIILHINEIEARDKQAIQKQLENRNDNTNEKLFFEKKMCLHLMYDSQFCDRFIHFVNKNFPNNEHKFIIIHNKNEKLKLMNIDAIENVEILDINYELNKLLYYIENCSKIFIHYLFDYFCEVVCRFNINKPIYWPLWGGDLYNYIDIEMYDPKTKQLLKELGYNVDNLIDNNQITYLYRRSTIRKIKFVLTANEGDYLTLKERFITKAKRIEFLYPNVTSTNDLMNKIDITKINLKSKYQYVILAGNSANPSNNHLDILYKLESLKFKNFCIVMPLSYGGDEKYISYVISEGKKIFGDRFIPIKEYLNSEDYYSLLSQVDIGLFNHNRQQGIGNINSLINLGKKIYMKKRVSSYKFFLDKGIKIYDIENYDLEQLFTFSAEVVLRNKKNLRIYMNDQYLLNCCQNIF